MAPGILCSLIKQILNDKENGEGYKPCRNEVLKCIRKMEKSDDKGFNNYSLFRN